MNDDHKLILIWAITVILVLGLALWGNYAMCNARTMSIGHPHQWKVIGGCFIEIDNKLIPLDNYRFQEGIKP